MSTYAKLKSGEWGLRVQGTAQEGQQVTVTKKDGSKKTETVGKVLWSGNGVSLCAIAGRSRTSGSSRNGRHLSDDDRCELCDKNKWTCGHCIGW